MTDGRYVEFGRWDEAHKALMVRVMAVENDLHGLRGAEQEHRALADRITVLEDEARAGQASERTRRDRIWAVVLLALGGLVLPLVASALVTWLHLRGK